MKYKYRASYWWEFKGHSKPRAKHFNDREKLVRWFATKGKHLIKIYMEGGNLKKGDTLDGFQREIDLTKQLIALEKQLKAN
jgi:hypothetical protein